MRPGKIRRRAAAQEIVFHKKTPIMPKILLPLFYHRCLPCVYLFFQPPSGRIDAIFSYYFAVIFAAAEKLP
jgi:hypothetical protein